MAYILKGDRSGTVRFIPTVGTITAESVSFSNKATSSPIESGGNINDHAVNDPIKFTVGGTVIGGTAAVTLEKMWQNRDLIEYQGKQRRSNLLMLSFSITESATNKNGFDFSISFQEMKIITAQTVQLATGKAVSSASGRSSASKTQNNGLITTSTQTVTTTSYLDSVNKVAEKKNNESIASARTNTSDSGYAR